MALSSRGRVIFDKRFDFSIEVFDTGLVLIHLIEPTSNLCK